MPKPRLSDKKKANALELELAYQMLDLVLSNKPLRLHLEARLGAHRVPKEASALKSIDVKVSQRNQAFLDFLMSNCRWIWYAIDTTEKQGDILDEAEKAKKEARLKNKMLGLDPEDGVDEPLGPTPAAL